MIPKNQNPENCLAWFLRLRSVQEDGMFSEASTVHTYCVHLKHAARLAAINEVIAGHRNQVAAAELVKYPKADLPFSNVVFIASEAANYEKLEESYSALSNFRWTNATQTAVHFPKSDTHASLRGIGTAIKAIIDETRSLLQQITFGARWPVLTAYNTIPGSLSSPSLLVSLFLIQPTNFNRHVARARAGGTRSRPAQERSILHTLHGHRHQHQRQAARATPRRHRVAAARI